MLQIVLEGGPFDAKVLPAPGEDTPVFCMVDESDPEAVRWALYQRRPTDPMIYDFVRFQSSANIE